jgi:hypothetical protein
MKSFDEKLILEIRDRWSAGSGQPVVWSNSSKRVVQHERGSGV